MQDLHEYISSEWLIHDILVRKTQRMVDKFRQLWSKGQRVRKACFFTWPAESIKDDNGKDLVEICIAALPDDPAEWAKDMKEMVVRTKAYALVLMEPEAKCVKFIFESQHGTRTWVIPIQRRGDVDVLGPETYEDNVQSVGLLWRKNRPSS